MENADNQVVEEKFVPLQLQKAAEIFKARNKIYGDNYKEFGNVMKALFPEQISITDPEEHGRFAILIQIVAKLSRYAKNFKIGGHNDSLDDLAVYSMMLKELDSQNKFKMD